MQKHTEVAVYEGDLFPTSKDSVRCHICGSVVPAGQHRLSFASIRNSNEHSATLSWCELCKSCGLQIVDSFKPRPKESSEGAKTIG